MRKMLSYYMILAAASLLLLHSFVPHQHRWHTDESCTETHSFLTHLLVSVFSVNLGERHLEHFVEKPQTLDFTAAVYRAVDKVWAGQFVESRLQFLLGYLFEKERLASFYIATFSFVSPCYFSLRAPPVLSY